MLIQLAAAVFMFAQSFLPTDAGTYNCSHPPVLKDFNIYTCCRLPEMNLGNTPEKCQNYIKSLKSYNPHYPPHAHMCYPHCIYRETGSMTNDVIHMEKVKRFLTKNIAEKDKDIVPSIVESFKSCTTSIDGVLKAVDAKEWANLKTDCSPYASMLYGCVNVETLIHCPASMWNSEQTNCDIAKGFIEQCNPLPHF